MARESGRREGTPERRSTRRRLTGPGGVALDVATIEWDESSEVAAIDCSGSPPRIQRLARGGRIGIRTSSDDERWMELRVSRLVSSDWSSEYQTNEEELSTICRLDIREALIRAGATGLGTRAEILGETGRRKNELAVSFAVGDRLTPIAAYCIVRVLPLLYGNGLEQASLLG
jgi:hypothetical protein